MKKLKLYIKQLFYRKLVVTVDSMNMCQVWHVEKGADNIGDALGLFPHRADELDKLCKATIQKSDDIVQALVIISKECRHANELCFCSVLVGKLQMDMMRPPSLFDALRSMHRED